MTQEELSRRVGITRSSVSAFENALKFPGIKTVMQLAAELEIPVAYLQNGRPIRGNRTGALSYRRKSRTPLTVQSQMSRQEEWLEDICSVYNAYIDFPEVNLPHGEPMDYEKLSYDNIEEISSELRFQWGMGLGPIANLTDFVEANGIVVGRVILDSNIDAVSVWRSCGPRVLLNKVVSSCARVRMSLAHELGHLVLHRAANEEDYDDKAKHDLMERQASFFAGCFLFPRRSFYNEFHSFRFDALVLLKKRWGISMGAIVMRAKNLDLLNEDNVTNFYKNLSTRGYSRRREPLDSEIPIEQIRLFSDAGRMLAENGINLQRIIDETLLAGKDFYALTDTMPMAGSEKNVKILQFRKDGG